MTALGDGVWLHAIWAAAVAALLRVRPGGRTLAAGLPLALLGGLVLRLLWYAFARSDGVETLASVLPAYAIPALLLEIGRRFATRPGDPVRLSLARSRDLALILGLAAGIAVTNGVALRIDRHALLDAGTACAVWLLALRTLLDMRPHLPPGPVPGLAPLVPAGFAALEATRLFFGDAHPVRAGLDVGPFPLWNALLAGYALPAAVLFTAARRLPEGPARTILGGAALAFLLAWLHYATRQLFHGAVLPDTAGTAERLVSTGLWLAVASVCLVTAVRRGSLGAARAGLATLGAATARVLFVDAGALPVPWLSAELVALLAVAAAFLAVRYRTRRGSAARPFAHGPALPMSDAERRGHGRE